MDEENQKNARQRMRTTIFEKRRPSKPIILPTKTNQKMVVGLVRGMMQGVNWW